MSEAFSSSNALDPEAGFTRTPSVGQAAQDLRAAATDKAREFASATAEQAAALKERAAEKAVQLKQAATEKAQQFRESATEQWQDTRHRAKELHVSAEDYIRQHPTKTVLGALGVGFLIGLIVRR